ncbi:hypothetical protein JW935_03285 [candidate division KSB1 bacterium]|nr:hypothetical protein [candidate division KSB1 bacterium]
MDKKKNNLLDYLYVLIKWRRLLIWNFIFVSVLAVGISLLLPRTFTSTSTILSGSDEGGFNLSSLVSNLPMAGFLSANMSEETNTFLAILNSRSLMEATINKFDLMKRWKSKNMQLALKEFRDHLSVDVNEDGSLSVTTEVKTPWLPSKEKDLEARKLTADMTNFIIAEMDKINTRLKIENARNSRIVIEKRYQQNLDDMTKAEEEFKAFQKKYGMIALEEQTEATIIAAAEVKAQVIAKEMEIDVMTKYLDSSHEDLIRARTELRAIKNKYDDMVKRSDQLVENKQQEVFISLGDVPELGIEYARLFREVTLQELLMEFILPQYEQAKIQEAKDTPTLLILDEGKIPDRKSKPKKAFFVIFWAVLSLILAGVYVFSREYLANLESQGGEDYDKVRKIMREFKFLRRKGA